MATRPKVGGYVYRRHVAAARRDAQLAAERLQLIVDRPDAPAVLLLVAEAALALARVVIALDKIDKIAQFDPNLKQEEGDGE